MVQGTLAEAAVAYAEAGLRVLPVWGVREDLSCACGNASCSSVGKHPLGLLVPSGAKGASRDPAVVQAWWQQQPQASIGWALDEDLVVLDLDLAKDGGSDEDVQLTADAELEMWLDDLHVELPATWQQQTGSGGHALVFRVPAGSAVAGRVAVRPLIDLRTGASGNYIVIPPSGHRSGGRYAWLNSLPIADLPAELLAALPRRGAEGGTGSRKGRVHLEPGALIHDGTRTQVIGSLAGSMRRTGLSPTAILAALEAENALRCVPPLEHDVLRRYAESAGAWEPDPVADPSVGFAAFQGLLWPAGGVGVAAAAAGVAEGAERPLDAPERAAEAGAELLSTGVPGLDERAKQVLLDRQARRLVDQAEAAHGFVEPPSRFSLAEELALEDPPLTWTVAGLHLAGMNTSLTAKFKTGKTTLQANLLKALCDGTPFLGKLETRPLEGRVALLNYELDEAMMRDWLRGLQIAHPERASVLNLRGYGLNVLSDWHRAWLVRWLVAREVEFLLLDPFARAFTGNENDNSEVKAWTDAIDLLKREAGVRDVQVTLHTGRQTEEDRARGATRLDDWVDARWILTRDAQGLRYLKAEGRRVELAESLLVHDPATGGLTFTLAAMSRRDVDTATVVREVLEALQRLGAGVGGVAVGKTELRGEVRRQAQEATAAIQQAGGAGLLERWPGDRPNQTLHRLTEAGARWLAGVQ